MASTAVAVGLLLVLYGGIVERMAELPSSSDFAKFYLSARFLRQGRDIYAPADDGVVESLGGEAPSEAFVLHPNLNPPFFSALLAPLSGLDYAVAYRVWSWLSLAAGVTAALLMERQTRAGPTSLARPLGAVALLLLYFPTLAAVIFGQVSLFLLLALVLAWRWLRDGREAGAGAALGLAAGVKLFVLLPLFFFLVRRRRRALAAAAVTGAGTLLIGLAAAGPDAYRSYLAAAAGVTWYAASWNASLLGFLSRILGGSENVPLWNVPWLAHGLTYALALAAVAGLIWLTWPRRGESAAVEELGYGLALALMLLLSHLGWMYYFPALAPALLAAWRWARTRAVRVLCLAAVALSGVPRFLVPSEEVNDPWMWFTWCGAYFYGLVLLSGVLLWLLAREREGARC